MTHHNITILLNQMNKELIKECNGFTILQVSNILNNLKIKLFELNVNNYNTTIDDFLISIIF